MTSLDRIAGAATDPAACPFMHDGFDFTDPDLLEKGLPIHEFAQLRKTAPVWWNAQKPGKGGGFTDGGYWVVSKHEHVRDISKNDALWSTNDNGVIMRFEDTMPPEALEITKALLINHDPPEHTRLRKLVSRLFTPRAVHGLEEKLATAAETIVKEAAANGRGDFVHQVAVELPLQAIADLLGVPQEDRHKLFEWSNSMMNADDPEFTVDPTTASAEVLGYAYQMAEARKTCPAEDIVTELVNADFDGESLSEIEFGYFFILLSVAGNETTRNAITHGMNAFLDHPDQWELYKRERPTTAADEIVRWATPVNSFQRTAREDLVLDGVQIKKGDRVGMFYGSANYDEEVFADPFTFDILRDPNPHVGFGGHGTHYCIGANLARMEINLIFNAIADHMPDITKLAEPERLRSGWLNGVKRLSVDYGTS
ncbi:steroid C27-monooxygenase [Williamsia sp. Leaf354]|uniref:cytochrome P450 n=1 Tax=Williamsia sp. Leaf354 TaxID=1736349 RepID=UPI0006FA0FC6|nr:cytochrome P450 [Williamsia sp. Leaf354]KQR99649.1 steroid C27-monooxygenase [Williamsia sp. Leaf354]